jgi:hypothetical protein
MTRKLIYFMLAQRDEVIERDGADERGCETHGPLAAK